MKSHLWIDVFKVSKKCTMKLFLYKKKEKRHIRSVTHKKKRRAYKSVTHKK